MTPNPWRKHERCRSTAEHATVTQLLGLWNAKSLKSCWTQPPAAEKRIKLIHCRKIMASQLQQNTQQWLDKDTLLHVGLRLQLLFEVGHEMRLCCVLLSLFWNYSLKCCSPRSISMTTGAGVISRAAHPSYIQSAIGDQVCCKQVLLKAPLQTTIWVTDTVMAVSSADSWCCARTETVTQWIDLWQYRCKSRFNLPGNRMVIVSKCVDSILWDMLQVSWKTMFILQCCLPLCHSNMKNAVSTVSTCRCQQ